MYMYVQYMNNHVHRAPLSNIKERKKEVATCTGCVCGLYKDMD